MYGEASKGKLNFYTFAFNLQTLDIQFLQLTAYTYISHGDKKLSCWIIVMIEFVL